MTEYWYQGAISPQVAGYIKDCMQRYPFPAEISEHPEVTRFQALFADQTYSVAGEDCMGQPFHEERSGIPYAIVPRAMQDSLAGQFIFFPSKEIHQAFCVEFQDILVDDTPFYTRLVT